MIVEAILIGLFAWRSASLLVDESGPFDIFARIRKAFGVREGPIEGFFPLLFSCIWCMSVWTTITAYLLWLLEPTIVMLGAAMAIALLADRFGHS